MTLPPYEWPTRITGLLTRPMVAFATATSSSVELRPCCDAMHSYPSACSGTINLLKQEPSAQSPWQKTMLFLVAVIFFSFVYSRVSYRRTNLVEKFIHRFAGALQPVDLSQSQLRIGDEPAFCRDLVLNEIIL